jgi:hypothetical protein
MMAISRWQLVSSVVDHRRIHYVSSPVMIRLQKSCLCQHCQSGHHKYSCECHIVRTYGTLCWVTRGLFRSSGRILCAGTMSNTCCCYSSIVQVQLTPTNTETSLILSSVQTILAQAVWWPSSKLSLPCAECLCHLNTALQCKASSLDACEKFC